MTPEWRTERLPDLVRAGFGALYSEITHEVYLLDGTGWTDTLWSAATIEDEALVDALLPP